MVKLLICLFCAAVLAGGMLQLRQQKRELAYQCSRLHSEIKSLQVTLWNQQLQIATATAPNAIERTVGLHDLALVPVRQGAQESNDHD